MTISAGGLAQFFARQAERTASTYALVDGRLRASGVVGADETGVCENGVAGYAGLVRTLTALLFRVERSRGACVCDPTQGGGFKGIVCSYCYCAHTSRDDLSHAHCVAYLIREAKKIAEASSNPRTQCFATMIRKRYRAGVAAQAHGDPARRKAVRADSNHVAHRMDFGLLQQLSRLLTRLHWHFEGIAIFFDRPDVPFTNNASEPDL